jgi:hypothetical protein
MINVFIISQICNATNCASSYSFSCVDSIKMKKTKSNKKGYQTLTRQTKEPLYYTYSLVKTAPSLYLLGMLASVHSHWYLRSIMYIWTESGRKKNTSWRQKKVSRESRGFVSNCWMSLVFIFLIKKSYKIRIPKIKNLSYFNWIPLNLFIFYKSLNWIS